MALKKTLSRKKRYTRRRRNYKKSRKLHGGCKDGNCLFQSQQQPLPASLPHSNFNQSGGDGPFAPSFSNVPIRSFYALNTYENDPSRLTVKGGKRKQHKRTRRQRGGLGIPSVPSLFSFGASTNPPNINDLKFHTTTTPYA